jgi:hypothetical protein
MGSFYTPNIPYGINDYLNNLGAYTLNEGVDQLLDMAREIEESQGYYWQGVVFPSALDSLFTPLSTFSGVITIPAQAFLVSISAHSIVPGSGSGEGAIASAADPFGFKFRIYDKGGKIDSFINSTFLRKVGAIGNMDVDPLTGTPPTIGPTFLQSPMVVLDPGALQMDVTSLNPNNNTVIQILMSMAIPVNRSSANEMLVGVHQ